MAKELSSAVKQALNDIYYNISAQRGAQGLALLEKASAAGDGDASCILARCLCGKQYVWAGHGFPEDDDRATMLLHKSVEQGSALGVLICMRTEELTPSCSKRCRIPACKKPLTQCLQLRRGATDSVSMSSATPISGGILFQFREKKPAPSQPRKAFASI